MRSGMRPVFGLDFGVTHDPTALFCGAVDKQAGVLYVLDEVYERQMSNATIFRALSERGVQKEVILADSAEPKSIAELRRLEASKIQGAKKGPDSVRFGISMLQEFEIVVYAGCVNFIREIGAYVWDKDIAAGIGVNRPDKRCADHLMDAMRYAMEGVLAGPRFRFG